MAASRIKGITVEIGGDTTKLQTALKGVNKKVTTITATLSRFKAAPINDNIYFAIFSGIYMYLNILH